MPCWHNADRGFPRPQVHQLCRRGGVVPCRPLSACTGTAARPDEVMVNRALAEAHRIRPGDSIQMWTAAREQTTGIPETTTVRVSGIVRFQLDAEGQYTIAARSPCCRRS